MRGIASGDQGAAAGERNRDVSEGVEMRVAGEIERRLNAALQPVELSLIDESDRHAGHAGARPGGESHFRVRIVAAAFAGRTRIERQRMVHAALGDLMESDVHALALTTIAPGEALSPPARGDGG